MLLNLSEIYVKDSPIFFPYSRRAFRSEVVSASNSISSTAFTTDATIAILNAGDFTADFGEFPLPTAGSSTAARYASLRNLLRTMNPKHFGTARCA